MAAPDIAGVALGLGIYEDDKIFLTIIQGVPQTMGKHFEWLDVFTIEKEDNSPTFIHCMVTYTPFLARHFTRRGDSMMTLE
jgi:hypothetical protein